MSEPAERPPEAAAPTEVGRGVPGALSRVIAHVDMDAFFASVEILDDPSLRGLPLIVGGDGARGVVASASYEARVHGIHSAMPSARAKRLCPQAVLRPGRYQRYAEVSTRMHAVFGRFTPRVEGIGLDEAFLDLTGTERLFGPPARAGEAIRSAVVDELGLRCSVGLAPVKFVAKMASVAAKPRADAQGVHRGSGVLVIEAAGLSAFLHPHPIEALWGVGPATAARLRRLGVRTVGELAEVPVDTLMGAVGRAVGLHLHALATGDDPRVVEVDQAVKSVGHEETFATDRHDRPGLQTELVRMADSVAARMRAAGAPGRTVQLKIRFSDFTTITRSRTVPGRLHSGVEIARVAGALLDQVDVGVGVRLLGVSVAGLDGRGDPAGEPEQLELSFGDDPGGARGDEERWLAATGAVDRVRARFGDEAVGPATLVAEDGLRVRRGDNRWAPMEGEGRLGNEPPAARS